MVMTQDDLLKLKETLVIRVFHKLLICWDFPRTANSKVYRESSEKQKTSNGLLVSG